MAEKILFPMEYLNITQGYGYPCEGQPANTFSHSGQKALDLKGRDTGIDCMYAPFSCVVKRITTGYNCVYFESLEPVERRDGRVTYMTFRCMHMSDEKMRELDMKIGRVFKQGEICYYEGVKGGATGNHIHIEMGADKFTGTGCYLASSGHYSINNPVFLNQVCWVPENVIIAKDFGYKWVRVNDVSNNVDYPPLLDECGNVNVGAKLDFNGQPLFNTSSGSASMPKSNCSYFIYDGKRVNDRYRVCAEPDKCGAGAIYISGWINGTDFGIPFPTNPPEEDLPSDSGTNETMNGVYKVGTKLIVTGKRIYPSSTAKRGVIKNMYTCFIYDGKCVNGRYRVCRVENHCNKGTQYVVGWVNSKDF